jgi:hypothetical protein
VDVFYNTFVVDGDLERGWVCVSMIREFAKKVLYPHEPSKSFTVECMEIFLELLPLSR